MARHAFPPEEEQAPAEAAATQAEAGAGSPTPGAEGQPPPALPVRLPVTRRLDPLVHHLAEKNPGFEDQPDAEVKEALALQVAAFYRLACGDGTGQDNLPNVPDLRDLDPADFIPHRMAGLVAMLRDPRQNKG